MTLANVFERISAILQRADIPYMLVGSFASSHYGAMRSTYDIDFLIAATLEQLRTLIRQKWIAELGLTAEWKKARQQAGFE